MAFSVLKKSRTDEKNIEVLGEFWVAEMAEKFAELMKSEDKDDEFEFSVESPTTETHSD